jgi:thymidine kinase|uniref:thymidine kinase n=1 Tax=viral metagenome TaxID=1070528 RepID=A0A6C0ILE7_9ZZZZ
MSGYLELIVGPMFSGKTSYLINTYKMHQTKEHSIKVINYSLDTRYDDKMLSSHDLIKIPCYFASKLEEEFESCKKNDIILINEGQFFPDLKERVLELVETYHKQVYICGLDSDFKRNKFGELLDLIPYCNKVTKLNANCECGNNAIFSHRKVSSDEQVLIGSDNYQPLCRTCYHDKN